MTFNTTLAICVAGELRTFFDVLPFLTQAVAAYSTHYFLQVSASCSSSLSGDKHWSCSGHDYDSDRVKTALASALSPANIVVENDSELSRHNSWRGDFLPPYTHPAFRWAQCHHDILEAELRRGSQFGWVLRMRPDARFNCQFISLPHPLESSVYNTWDFVSLMPRAVADISLRQYPLGFGLVPCLPPSPFEACNYFLLRSHNITTYEVRGKRLMAEVLRPGQEVGTPQLADQDCLTGPDFGFYPSSVGSFFFETWVPGKNNSHPIYAEFLRSVSTLLSF